MREIVETAPGHHTVFSGTKPEAIFTDALDARCFAAMRDVLDDPTDTAARYRLSDCADILAGVQHVLNTKPKGKRVKGAG